MTRRAAAARLTALAAALLPLLSLPPSTLAVRVDDRSVTWWRSDRAPVRYPSAGDTLLARAARFAPLRPGLDLAQLEIAGRGEAWRTRVVAARLDPARFRLRLDTAFDGALEAAWTLDRADSAAALAVNAGQFLSAMPWGWVVLDGHQFLPPGRGPLAPALVIDSAERVAFVSAASLAAQLPAARWAFQSYPALVERGVVPLALRDTGRGLDVAHRDARAAIGLLPDGRLLVVLTRFDALGASLGFVPFGLTVPEMAALMGSLGATDAMLLDGGISAQLLLRGTARTLAWRGLRSVPLALVAVPR